MAHYWEARGASRGNPRRFTGDAPHTLGSRLGLHGRHRPSACPAKGAPAAFPSTCDAHACMLRA
jgi:hypothetical protein